jgi:hypothetical protein
MKLSSFWLNPGGTILQEQDLEVLRMIDESQLINVNIAHITSAQGKSISLNTGEKLETDGIVLCTGWLVTLHFFYLTTDPCV